MHQCQNFQLVGIVPLLEGTGRAIAIALLPAAGWRQNGTLFQLLHNLPENAQVVMHRYN